jgi:serine/threonine protein kinase
MSVLTISTEPCQCYRKMKCLLSFWASICLRTVCNHKIPIPGQEKIALDRFEKEYSVLIRLDHPNIVKAIDFSSSFPYLVLEYKMAKMLCWPMGTIPCHRRKVCVFLQLHDAIKYLHQK